MGPSSRSVNTFDDRPIEIGGFRLVGRSATPIASRVTLDGWALAYEYATHVEENSPYWISDLLNYADTRADWRERFEQAKSATGLSEGRLHNVASVGRRVQGRARELAPTFRHSTAVADLDPKDQETLLEQAKTEGWSSAFTRKQAKRLTRPRVLAGQATLSGMFRVIYADCPWIYRNTNAMPDGSQTPAEDSYDGLSVDQLCALPVAAHALDDAVLFLWSTASHLLEIPGPRDVIAAWGFEYKSCYVWDKVLGRPGHYSYVQHEILAVATRGSCTPDVAIEQHRHASIFTARRKGEHSEKPIEARQLITSLYTEGPYLELFARKPVENWTTFGNDARLWMERSA